MSGEKSRIFGPWLVGFVLCAGAAGAQEMPPNAAPPSSPLWSQADTYYGPQEMAQARKMVQEASGGMAFWRVAFDRVETQISNAQEQAVWDVQGWYGGDINKLWVKTEGEFSFTDDDFEEAEIQALWSRAISPYFDFQAGVRYDLNPKSLAHGVIGVQGLAPYWFEIDASAFISVDGDVTARLEAEYDVHLSQWLVLQPRVEIALAAQDIPELNIEAGITDLQAGLRLRYAVKRQFSPYIGVAWHSKFGGEADLARAQGEGAKSAKLVLGVSAWF